ncbi:MAG: tetratricopeptide repeat protein [Thermodesulfobacteriota bacterium]
MSAIIERIFSSKVWPIAILIVVSLLVFANTLYNGFVFDDGFQIIDNKWIRDPSYIPDIFTTSAWGFKTGSTSNYYRPLMHISFMIDYAIFGLVPWGFHLTNILVHALNSTLVYMIAMLFYLGPGISYEKETKEETGIKAAYLAFASALIFAVHPVHTEVVAWISAIPEASFTFFFLVSLYTYMLYSLNKEGRKNFVLLIVSLAAFIVSLLCKETALTLIGVIAIFDLSINRSFRGLKIKRYLPYIVVIIGYMALRVSVFSGLVHSAQHTYLTSFQYLLNVFPLIADYVWLILWPVNLNAFALFKPVLSIGEPRLLISLVVILALLALFISAWKKKLVFFGLLWAIFTLAPALYIPAIGATKMSVFHDRYLYLPSAGFILVAVYLLARILKKLSPGKAVAIFTLLILIFTFALAARTIARNRVWRDNYTFWKVIAEKTTESEIVYINIGNAASERGLKNEALRAYLTAQELDPENAVTLNNIGFLYFQTERIEESIESYKMALKFAANIDYKAKINENLGDAFIKISMMDEAIESYRASIESSALNANLYNKLGIAYGNAGRFDEAAISFEKALKINPAHLGARTNLEKVEGLKR